jgi:RNA recognition motif-containing protein
MNIYVGSLSYDASEENLRQAFGAFGQVSSARIVKDKYSGQPRGFGFVEMLDQTEAQTAIENLNGKDLLGQQMNVSEARPRTGQGRSGGQGGQRGRPGYGGSRNLYWSRFLAANQSGYKKRGKNDAEEKIWENARVRT